MLVLSLCLFLSIKFYWNTVTFLPSCIVCGYFHAAWADLSNCVEDLKCGLSRPLQKTSANPVLEPSVRQAQPLARGAHVVCERTQWSVQAGGAHTVLGCPGVFISAPNTFKQHTYSLEKSHCVKNKKI